MLPHEAVNSSLSTLIFAYNNHYRMFRSPDVQSIYKSLELLDTTIKCSDDFEILTHNDLLSAFQTHCIIADEAAKRYRRITGRPDPIHPQKDPLFYPIHKFLHELRCAHAHLEKKFLKVTWDTGYNDKKKAFIFTIHVPISKDPKNPKKGFYDPKSKIKKKFSFQGIPGREIRLNQHFIHRIILFSFHLIKIFSFRKIHTCNDFLNQYKSNWL